MTISELMDIMRKYTRVEDTFNLRWTGRYRFDFAERPKAAPSNEQGGTIVFPVGGPGPGEIERAIKTVGVSSAYSMGNYFLGRYRSLKGSVFDGRSSTVHIEVMTKHDLIKFGADLARELGNLECVLVQFERTREIYVVTSK